MNCYWALVEYSRGIWIEFIYIYIYIYVCSYFNYLQVNLQWINVSLCLKQIFFTNVTWKLSLFPHHSLLACHLRGCMKSWPYVTQCNWDQGVCLIKYYFIKCFHSYGNMDWVFHIMLDVKSDSKQNRTRWFKCNNTFLKVLFVVVLNRHFN